MLCCPECGGKTKVRETRDTQRVRHCLSCNANFKTVEQIENKDETGFVKVPIEMYEAVNVILKQLQRDQRLKSWSSLTQNNN